MIQKLKERGGKKQQNAKLAFKGKLSRYVNTFGGKQSHEREKIILIISQVKCAEQRVDINYKLKCI